MKMKAHFFLPLILFFLACTDRDANSRDQSAKPNHLTVIIDDPLWNGEVGDSIRKKFASPIVGLPQEEPMLSITQYPLKLMEGYMSNDRNILVVKKDDSERFKIEKDKRTKPQNIIYISGRSVPLILQQIEKNATAITELIHETEIQVAQSQIDSSPTATKILTDSFHVRLKVPSAYKSALSADRFVWLKKDMIGGNMNLLVYEVPLSCLEKNGNLVSRITHMRDSIGSLYIHGTEPDSRMITEKAFAPYLNHTKLAGRKTYETRGTWELINDYMSGPFINLAVVDKSHRRILVLEGFCYAPSKEKRELMHELEAILRSATFLP